MKKIAVFLSFVFAVSFLVACNDDDSGVSAQPSDELSSGSKNPSSSSVFKRVQCDVETDENCMRDDRDGQTYKTVTIGTQTWMAENANFETEKIHKSRVSYCYNDVASNCEKYGRLYTWPATGACPDGWHLPSKKEWETFIDAIGDSLNSGKMLKSTSGWDEGGNGSDAFGFSALPAGRRYDEGSYGCEGSYADFWSSTDDNYGSVYTHAAHLMELRYDYDKARVSGASKDYAFSVRCLKN